MKKRIAAAALAVVLMVNIVGDHTRARAEPVTITAIAAIGILAFNLLGLMSGRYDDTAEAIGVFLENGVEGWEAAFIGSEDTPSWFATGWNDIFTACSDWFESGEISLDENGLIEMDYQQYLELCQLMMDYVDININLGLDVAHTLLRTQVGSDILVQSVLDTLDFATAAACNVSFVPCFYNQDSIYISGTFVYQSFGYSGDGTYAGVTYKTFTSSGAVNNIGGLNGQFLVHGDSNNFYSGIRPYFSFADNSIKLCYYSSSGNFYSPAYSVGTWYSFSDDKLVECSYSDVDINYDFGYLCINGLASDHLYDLSSYSASADSSQLNDLSDPLAPVLDVTDNPSLIIDTDPDIVNPVDSVTVSDIPGQADIPLSDLMESLDLDIDIPSVLATKFPFCIPFDFIRILSVLCADPKAPVFVIPLSTDPENLKGFEGNQTIGDIPEDFTPMFEIDEEIVIDLSVIPLVQPVCYAIFIIGFVVMLIMITSKMINH